MKLGKRYMKIVKNINLPACGSLKVSFIPYGQFFSWLFLKKTINKGIVTCVHQLKKFSFLESIILTDLE